MVVLAFCALVLFAMARQYIDRRFGHGGAGRTAAE